jgi:hypothetical protein
MNGQYLDESVGEAEVEESRWLATPEEVNACVCAATLASRVELRLFNGLLGVLDTVVGVVEACRDGGAVLLAIGRRFNSPSARTLVR